MPVYNYNNLFTRPCYSPSSDVYNCEAYQRVGNVVNLILDINWVQANSFCNIFHNCQNLYRVHCNNWDTTYQTINNYVNAFRRCFNLKYINIDNWITPVDNMYNVFCQCNNLTNVNVSQWDTINCSNFALAFNGCQSLTNISIENWNVCHGTTFVNMFRNCYNLTTLNIANWNLMSATNIAGMFTQSNNLDNNTIKNIATSFLTATNLPAICKTFNNQNTYSPFYDTNFVITTSLLGTTLASQLQNLGWTDIIS